MLAVSNNATSHLTHQRKQLIEDATSLLRLMASDVQCQKLGIDWSGRLSEITTHITETGTYSHTASELEFGARLAWRNSNRCIGRHMWRSLRVLDRRETVDLDGVIGALRDHLNAAWNGGRIQSVISISLRDTRSADPAGRRAHRQPPTDPLCRVCGRRRPHGRRPSFGRPDPEFDGPGMDPEDPDGLHPLPWSIWLEDECQPPYDAFAHHPEWLHEVHITHPDNPDFAALGLKWYAVPAISEMALVIGGIVYPCAPFNGWYMGTEVGARNFGDTDRYDMLPAVARVFDLDTSSERQLWRDRALVELNRAVLHSYDPGRRPDGRPPRIGPTVRAVLPSGREPAPRRHRRLGLALLLLFQHPRPRPSSTGPMTAGSFPTPTTSTKARWLRMWRPARVRVPPRPQCPIRTPTIWATPTRHRVAPTGLTGRDPDPLRSLLAPQASANAAAARRGDARRLDGVVGEDDLIDQVRMKWARSCRDTG